ncbi:hypothetical protein DFH08DRAFT_499611 [Mycena albidolilacea]|uniref:Uncharacterized protein n=1 Tax=Mycena albidolilacea TaxID=1033008 RepID=A0AAD7ACW0_9AGAR|nr:hypothetical protein DFH08DRAFT_499611 [Mycena albidolilacea]
MLASLGGQDPDYDSEGPSDEDEGMPPLERVGGPSAENWPLPMMFNSDTDGEMPGLASVSNSSDSDAVSEDQDDDEDDDEDNFSSTLEPGDAPYDRMPNIRPFDLGFDPGMDARDDTTNQGMFMRLRSFLDDISRADAELSAAESSARTPDPGSVALDSTVTEPPVSVDALDGEDADDESDMPPLEREPPFVTDGRGRVVWSSSSDSGSGYSQQASSSAPRRASVNLPGAFPSNGSVDMTPSPRQSTSDTSRQAAGQGGFTTDGRGRVIGTTSTREGEEEEGSVSTQESSTPDEATVPTRSFFGRVLDAFF